MSTTSTAIRYDWSDASPVRDIAPVDGWVLWAFPQWDGDGFVKDGYFARGAECDVMLDVSRFRFSPSQDRFAWLVHAGFPRRPSFGPWDDTDIEIAMGNEVVS